MQTNRRKFLKKVGAATVGTAVFPTFIKASVLGREGHVPPSDKITMIGIGCGSMGQGNLGGLQRNPGVVVIAACDVDDNHLAQTKKRVDEHNGNNDCRIYKDYREILEKEKADTAMLALPDHWHALIACAVVEKKMDVYGEKPLARSIVESRTIVNAAKKNNVIWQMGSWQRSQPNFLHAAELVINGRIGDVKYVEVGLPNGGQYIGNPSAKTIPEGLDWEMWLGPAPEVPYRGVSHWDWRWINDYSGGQLTDWAGHHIDIAHWGLGLDRTGPVTIEGAGRRHPDGLYDVYNEYDFMCEYASGVKIRVANNQKLRYGGGVHWVGSDGWIHVDRGRLEASDEKILKEVIGDEEIRLYKSRNHTGNFVECVKSRKETITPCDIGHRSISVGLLGEIAMITGDKLHWDPETEKFTDNNPTASRLLERPYRAPWKLPEY